MIDNEFEHVDKEEEKDKNCGSNSNLPQNIKPEVFLIKSVRKMQNSNLKKNKISNTFYKQLPPMYKAMKLFKSPVFMLTKKYNNKSIG